MSQRHEAHDSLDDFPTPPWAGRALCEYVIQVDKLTDTVWEPACNRGYLVEGLKDYFHQFVASDVHQYGDEKNGNPINDFLFPAFNPQCDWIITNPPFRLAEQFAFQALDRAKRGVALLVRTQFLESSGRYQNLFSKFPPLVIAQFTERVPMVRGRCDPKASTATAYCWVVWDARWRSEQTGFVWIPPCRKSLERERDYD